MKSKAPAEIDNLIDKDLEVLEAMLDEIESYYRSESLFLPLSSTSLPNLTTGGILLRIHRLSGIEEIMDETKRNRVERLKSRFEEHLSRHSYQIKEKVKSELNTRLRQWGSYLQELFEAYGEDTRTSIGQLKISILSRVMTEDLYLLMKKEKFEIPAEVNQLRDEYDRALSFLWQDGPFIWHDVWQAAYPKSDYWWMYGNPNG